MSRFKAGLALTAMPPLPGEQLRESADKYVNLFEAYVAIADRIESGKADYLVALQVIEPTLEQVHAFAERNAYATRDRVRRVTGT